MAVQPTRGGELRRELRAVGFRIDEVLPIDTVRAEPIDLPWLGHAIRAGGWLVFATRPG